jgi:very-short-patch-repair endonuclease
MENLNLFNRKELKPLRSSLRKRSTSAEASLWEMLKSKKMDGMKFRRQYSIGYYIADFCCPSEKIIIELDGDPQIIEKCKKINHPSRKQTMCHNIKHCLAATPPSKGGESSNLLFCQNLI